MPISYWKGNSDKLDQKFYVYDFNNFYLFITVKRNGIENIENYVLTLLFHSCWH
jgi:hypothetical protein